MTANAFPTTIGRYRVLARVGRGAMGVVFSARDPHIDRTVAIKLLPLADDDLRQRFLQEIRSLGTLNHPNIVTIYDCGEHDEQPFIAMEYVDGVTVADAIRMRRVTTLAAKLQLVHELCSALQYAHQRSIIHRDIKPANLMINQEGALKVLDFGVARMGEAHATRTGTMVGTPSYMAPEQFSGTSADKRTDIFSVGLVIYELLASRQAFPVEGKTLFQMIHAVLHDQPPSLSEIAPEVDPELQRIVERAIQKDPTARYPTLSMLAKDMAAVRARLEQSEAIDNTQEATLWATQPVDLPSTTEPDTVILPVRRRFTPTWMVVSAVALAVVVGLASAFRLSKSATPDRPAAPPVAAASAPNQPIAQTKPPTISLPSAPERAAQRPPASERPPAEARPQSSKTVLPAPVPATTQLPANEKDEAKTASITQPACDESHAAACVALGIALQSGRGMAKDVVRARVAYQKACDGGDISGCRRLGVLVMTGDGGEKNERRGAELFQRACDAGDAESCNDMGVAHSRGDGVEKNDARAFPLYEQACNAGSPRGCLNMGRAYAAGRGVGRDQARAFAAFKRACDGNLAAGCGATGEGLRRGLGVPADVVEAAKYLQRACDGGGGPACRILSTMYEQGQGVMKDATRAAALALRAQNFDNGGNPASVAGPPGLAADTTTAAAPPPPRVTDRPTAATASVNNATAPMPPGVFRVGGDIRQPAKIKEVKPAYPVAAQYAGVQGPVVLQAIVGPDGKVAQTKVVRSIPLLDGAAEDAVRQWQFAPTIVNGTPVSVAFDISINFTLADGAARGVAP